MQLSSSLSLTKEHSSGLEPHQGRFYYYLLQYHTSLVELPLGEAKKVRG